MIEIKNRYTGDVIYVAKDATDMRSAVEAAIRDGAHLRGANLRWADLYGANLRWANLYEADLYEANLRGANLYGADLRGANLRGANLYGANLYEADLHEADLRWANLYGANLRGAENLNRHRSEELLMLRFQTGKIRAFKMVSPSLRSPMQNSDRITYNIGETIEVTDANTDETTACGAGINVATAPWVLANFVANHRILLVQFTAKDIAAIPINSDGKFRVHKCKVVREVKPEELGINPDGTDIQMEEGANDAS